MSMNLEIIKIAGVNTDKIDYDRIIFKLIFPKRVNIDNSRNYFILLKALADGGARKVLIDLHNMEFIDSSGIGILVSIAKLIRAHGGDITLSGPTSEVLAIFKVVNLQDFIKIFTTEGEAINHFHAL